MIGMKDWKQTKARAQPEFLRPEWRPSQWSPVKSNKWTKQVEALQKWLIFHFSLNVSSNKANGISYDVVRKFNHFKAILKIKNYALWNDTVMLWFTLICSPTSLPYFLRSSLRFILSDSNTRHRCCLWVKFRYNRRQWNLIIINYNHHWNSMIK